MKGWLFESDIRNGDSPYFYSVIQTIDTDLPR